MHQIGVGVLGPVFRTYEPSEDRLVAVKAFHLDITPEQAHTLIEALERLVETKLAHPGVVAPLAIGLEDDVPYIAQEYVAAESLDVAVRHYSPATLEAAMPFISQIAAAVDAAHARGVVHGALHLRDIFVTPNEARVTGFGIVAALEEIGLAGPIRRPYTAPEVIAGREWCGAADRFALAAIAYELLTGRRAAGTGDQVTERIRSIEGVADPEHLEEVFATALADDPEDRYSSGARFVLALETSLDEEHIDAVGVEHQAERRDATAPLDLLAGIELHRENSEVDQALNPADRAESTFDEDFSGAGTDDSSAVSGAVVDEGIGPADPDVELHVSATEYEDKGPDYTIDDHDVRRDDPADVSVHATAAEDEHGADPEVREYQLDAPSDLNADPVGAERRDDDLVSDVPVIEVTDGVPQEDEEDDDEGNEEKELEALPVLPPPTQDSRRSRSVWSRGIIPVLATALVVGSVAYFLGMALALRGGQTDEVLESQGASDPANREVSEELAGSGGGAPAVGAAVGSPASASEPVALDAPADTGARGETGSDAPQAAMPDPETRASETSAGSPEPERPDTRTVRLPPSGVPADPQPLLQPSVSAAPPAVPEVTQATGWVLVRTDPPGATVTLDGVARGQTPLSLRDVSFGTHRLELSRAGFGTVRREVTVNAQVTVVPVGVELPPARRSSVAGGGTPETGLLAVQSRPSGARVTVDGTSAGVTPLLFALPVGRHQVRIEGDGYQAWVTSVDVTSAERAQVNASLERLAR